MNITLWISISALEISIASFVNAWHSSKSSRRDSLFNLRKQALLKANEIKHEWQQVLNDHYHFIHLLKSQPVDPRKKLFIESFVNDINETFTQSHQNACDIYHQVEVGFDKISKNETELYISKFEVGHMSIKASREELSKRLDVLLDTAKIDQIT